MGALCRTPEHATGPHTPLLTGPTPTALTELNSALLGSTATALGAAPRDTVDVDYAQPGSIDNDYSDRIIGGVVASVEEYPFIVSIAAIFAAEVIQIQRTCGGTIIKVDWVMTAAHCLVITECADCLSEVIMRGGSSYKDKGGVVRKGTSIVFIDQDHDIALIQVDEVWPLNGETISLARLPHQDDPIPADRSATIMGWGGIDKLGTDPGILMKQEVQILSHSLCSASYLTTSITITDKELCTFVKGSEKLPHAYLGDSGSPVVADNIVVGIVSSGVASSIMVFPDIHTRVSSYIDWIEQNVGPLPSTE